MPNVRDYLYARHRKGDHDVIYEASDVDDAADVHYFGFLNNSGGWIIQKEDTSVSPKTYRYIMGNSDFATNWTNRASLSYVYYNLLFS